MTAPAELSAEFHGVDRRAWMGEILRSLRATRHYLLIVLSAPSNRYHHRESVLRLTEGRSVGRELGDFARTSEGAELLRERPDVRRLLKDRGYLESCSDGSLGRVYSQFLSAAQLDEGNDFELAADVGAQHGDSVGAWYRTRVGVMRGLRHVISGYGCDRLGKACLLIFRFAQTGHRGQLALGVLALLNAALEGRGSVLPAVFEAYGRGRHARSTDMVAWEKGLDAPLVEHRAWLRLGPPERYAAAVAPEAFPRPHMPHRQRSRSPFAAVFRPFRAAWHFLRMAATVGPVRYHHAGMYLGLTEGESFEREFAELASTTAGAELLEERTDVLDLLTDPAVMERCPQGSLGRVYSDFLRAANLDPKASFVAIREVAAREPDPARVWFRARTGVMHDIRHAFTGYGADSLGEACLLAFRYAQIRHPGLLVMLWLSVLLALGPQSSPRLPALREAYRRGRRARSIDVFPWERNLANPLAAQRASLGIGPPEHYAPSLAPDAYLNAAGASV